MAFQETSSRATTLVEAVRNTFQKIGKLAQEADPDLAQAITEELKDHEDGLALLQEDITDLHRGNRGDNKLASQVARLSEDIKHARSQYRRAQLSGKRSSERQRQQDRQDQFNTLKQSYLSGSKKEPSTDLFAGRRTNKNLTEDELLVNTSSDITLALRQTHERLTSELSRSRFAQETLVQSTAALSDLGERYSTLDNLLTNSRNLLSTLVKSQKSDTWYLETAFYILVATLVWLIFRRIIYGPAWWFIWLPIKYFLFAPFGFVIKAFSGSPSAVGVQQSSRPPLKIKPSASGGPVRNRPDFTPQVAQPVGGGGIGAKRGPDGEYRKETLVETIGKMAEESRAAVVPEQEEKKGGETVEKVRADGTKLQERGDIKPNPKKKMFEADVEDKKYEEQQQQQQPVRDEL